MIWGRSNSLRFASLLIVAVAANLAFGGMAYGASIASTGGGGNWNQTNTWGPASVPNLFDDVTISLSSPVVVTDTHSANYIHVNDTLSIGGDLFVIDQVSIGTAAAAIVTTSGATFGMPNFVIGNGGGTGKYVHDGVALSQTIVGSTLLLGFASAGELEIRGPNGPISIGAGLGINPNGTLRITPTGNGSGGLVTIGTNSATLLAGCALVLDDNMYTPQLGDSWVVISSSGAINGSFTTLTAPAGFTISQAVAKAVGTVTITVTAVPAAPPVTAFSVVNGGNWNQISTWEVGGNPAAAVPLLIDNVFIDSGFPVVVTDTQAAAIIITSADLSVGGDLSVTGNVNVGFNAASTMTTSGGTLSPDNLFIGVGDSGTYVHDGVAASQTVVASNLIVGATTPGELEVRGTNGPFTVGAALGFTADGTLRVTPTANGAAGLETIIVGTILGLNVGSTLVLDDSLYALQAGDSWTIISAGSVSGTFTNLVPPSGVTFSVVGAKGGSSVTITVDGVAASGLPASNYWGLAILAALLGVVGAVYMSRRAGSTEK